MPVKRKTGGWQPPKVDKCAVCDKTVYVMEKLEADKKVYHKKCFRCSECNKAVSLGGYAALEGKVRQRASGRCATLPCTSWARNAGPAGARCTTRLPRLR